jgi:UDP-N-acetylmuramyl pentapeptide phosphotransferase/UDP-N-acetylglucosamine-1-phosphate transferase
MTDMPLQFSVTIVAMLSSVATILWVRRFALRTRMLDLPGQRRNHAHPTPRGGGLGVVTGALLPLPLVCLAGSESGLALLGYALGATLIAVAGWVDDRRGLAASIRLAVQMLAASVFLISMQGLSFEAVAPLVWVGAWLLLVGLSNVWNFMDGINGIAGSQAMLVAGALTVVGQPPLPWSAAALAVAVASAAFLPFNLPSARIFLGDVGSATLGFMIAALLAVAVADGRLPWPMALVLVSAFGIDSALTLGRRIVHGKPWWRAHREHTYQWLVRAGLPHWRVTVLYGTWTVASIVIAAMTPAGGAALAAAVLWLSLGVMGWIALRRWVLRQVERKPR